jgi:hypothetical protein
VLASRLREAERVGTKERVERLVDRIKKRFLADNPRRATRNDARLLIEELDHSLGDTLEAEDVRTGLRKLRTKYRLNENPLDDVPDYATFSTDVEAVALAPRLKGQLPEIEVGADVSGDKPEALPIAVPSLEEDVTAVDATGADDLGVDERPSTDDSEDTAATVS